MMFLHDLMVNGGGLFGGLAAFVGSLATLWIALKTHRIVNSRYTNLERKLDEALTVIAELKAAEVAKGV